MSAYESLDCIILIQHQNSTTKESNATSEIERTLKERPKSTCIWPAYKLTCSPHVLSHVSVTVPVYWPWPAPTKIKQGGHFSVLTGMWIFQNRNLHRATNPAKSQAKIRFVFHFVERSNITGGERGQSQTGFLVNDWKSSMQNTLKMYADL